MTATVPVIVLCSRARVADDERHQPMFEDGGVVPAYCSCGMPFLYGWLKQLPAF